MSEQPRVSIVIPAYEEGDNIVPVLDRLFESVRLSCEVLVVVDSAEDSTVSVVCDYAEKEPRLRHLHTRRRDAKLIPDRERVFQQPLSS